MSGILPPGDPARPRASAILVDPAGAVPPPSPPGALPGFRGDAAPAPAVAPAQEAGPPPIDEVVLQQTAQTNPLLAAALPLLTLVCQLRNTIRHDDVPRLQWMVSEELKAFESRALVAEASPQDVVAGRYVLCSLIDETVLSTPWGGQSRWAAQSMLSIFHKETWGGEKVFVILDRIKPKPARYLHLLELIDTCLALGFRGRFGVLENGLYQLEELRADLWRIIRGQRNLPQTRLSPELKVERVRRALVTYVPLWVVFAAAAVVLVLTYGALQFALTGHTDTAAALLARIAPGN